MLYEYTADEDDDLFITNKSKRIYKAIRDLRKTLPQQMTFALFVGSLTKTESGGYVHCMGYWVHKACIDADRPGVICLWSLQVAYLTKTVEYTEQIRTEH